MTTREARVRPADIPQKCTRGVCGGTVFYTEELDGDEWKCNLCGHIYVVREKRLDWINLNHEKILRDVVFKGNRQALVFNPLQFADIKYLKEKYPELYNRLIKEKQVKDKELIEVATVKPSVSLTPPKKIIPPAKESLEKLVISKDGALPFGDFLDKITGMDKEVQLRLIDIYEKKS